jgi:hypothetical protein
VATEPSRPEANRLYWETETSVGRIADRLGVSRRALYELLDPAVAGGLCPDCGSPLLFQNRLARATGEAQCGSCGRPLHLAGVPRPRPLAERVGPGAATAPRPRAATSPDAPPASSLPGAPHGAGNGAEPGRAPGADRSPVRSAPGAPVTDGAARPRTVERPVRGLGLGAAAFAAVATGIVVTLLVIRRRR